MQNQIRGKKLKLHRSVESATDLPLAHFIVFLQKRVGMAKNWQQPISAGSVQWAHTEKSE